MMEGNVPRLRFLGFDGDWNSTTFAEVVKINQGLQIPIDERYLEQVDGSHFYITNEFLKANSEKKYFIKNPTSSVLCTKDDILMTRTGNTGMVVTNVEGAFHNNFFKIKYPSSIDKNFLFNFLKLPRTQRLILTLAGTSTIPDLNHADFYKINFTYPEITEQSKVSAFVNAVDDKLLNLKKKKSLLEQYKKGMMQKIFSQELRFKDDDGKEFGEWKEKTISDVLTMKYGKDQKQIESIDGSYPILGTGGEMGRTNSFLYDKPSVLIGRKGTIDKPMYLDSPFWTVDTLFYTEIKEGNLPKWVFFLFQTINWYLYNEASGVPSLSTSTINKIPVTVPPFKEQIRITNFLSTIDDKINLVSQQVEKVEVWKKGLLGEMFV